MGDPSSYIFELFWVTRIVFEITEIMYKKSARTSVRFFFAPQQVGITDNFLT